MTKAASCAGDIAAASGPDRPVGLRFRDAFLGTVAAGALSIGCGGPALAGPDLCTTSGAVATCSGDQSAGIASGTDFLVPAVTTLNVNNLTRAITPASGTSGISVNSTGNVVITSDTGAFGVTTNNAAAIYGRASGFSTVTVTSTGNITTAANNAIGIIANATGTGDVTVSSTGNINTAGLGIFARSFFSDVSVTSTGSIAGRGIYAGSIRNGAVTVTSTGNITTAVIGGSGIEARSRSGAITVTSTGNLDISGGSRSGIIAYNRGGSPITVTSTGNIATAGDLGFGIQARGGVVTLTSTGNIATAGLFSSGIYAVGSEVAVTSTGNIATTGDGARGIRIEANGVVSLTSTGNIATTGSNAHGIYALNFGAGPATVTSTGNITITGANSHGIYAKSFYGTPISIAISSGKVSGGSGTGAGVSIVDGTTNTLTNKGTVTALSGLAISATTGNDTVNNSGAVIGNVDLGTGTNAFNNLAGGVFNSGATVNLGAGNVLANAGTLSPGGAGAVLTTALTGNLVQTAPGILLADINIAGNTADRVNVSGTANLAGAVQVKPINPILGPWQQTVLSAAGGTTNNGLTLLASPALQAQLVYPNVTDVAVRSTGIDFVSPGLNVNQAALGNALNGAAQGAGLNGPIFNLLLNVTSAPLYNSMLSQLSGEGATGVQQSSFDAMNTFMGLMLDPSNRGTSPATSGGASGYAAEHDASAFASDGRKRSGAEREAYAMFTKVPPAAFMPRWSVWAAGYGGSQTTDGNATIGSSATTSRIFGGAVGVDYRFSPNTIAGFALAGGGTNYVVGNALGTGRSDLFQAGVFVRHTVGPAYISGALAYGWQDVTTDRTLLLAGLDRLQARFNANAYSGRIEGGYRFVGPWMGVGITPYAAGQFTTFELPAYAERAIAGSNQFALAYGAKSVTAPRSELGVRTDKSWEAANATLTLRGRLAWAHDYSTDRSIGATFQTLPGASFVVNGAAQGADKALTTSAIEVNWRNGLSLSGVFESEYARNVQSYSGKGVARYTW